MTILRHQKSNQMSYDIARRYELERIIIGEILTANDSQIKDLTLRHGINRSTFFRDKVASEVYKIILSLWREDKPVDITTVYDKRPEEYRKDGQSSVFTNLLISFTQNVVQHAHYEHHLWLLKQYLIAEYWHTKADKIKEDNWDVDDCIEKSDELVEGYQNLFENITSSFKRDNSIEDLKEAARIKFNRAKSGQKVGIPTGLHSIDMFTDGFQPAELNIVAARPGMGKTTVTMLLATKMSYNFNHKGAFLSLEMTKTQLMNRIIAKETGMDYKKIKSQQISEQEFETVLEWYDFFAEKSNLKIEDSLEDLNDIVAYVKENDIKFLIIDYLQLVKVQSQKKSQNREQDVAHISRTLKQLAKSEDIVVIALAQLSRAVESRPNKRPLLSDLRESGSLEQDADNVIFLYRDAYYREKNGEVVPDAELGNLEYIIAKGRETGTRNFQLNLNFKINDIEEGFKYGTYSDNSFGDSLSAI